MSALEQLARAGLAVAVLSVSAQGVHAQDSQADDDKAPTPIACDFTVTGRNDPTVDVLALSNAVNGGGLSGEVTVCLSGTFDFGEGPPPAGQLQIAPAPAV